MKQRRRIKQILSLEERLAEEAKRLRDQAKRLPPGPKREILLCKARQDETTSRLTEWLHRQDCSRQSKAAQLVHHPVPAIGTSSAPAHCLHITGNG
jgi:hypothetical protein